MKNRITTSIRTKIMFYILISVGLSAITIYSLFITARWFYRNFLLPRGLIFYKSISDNILLLFTISFPVALIIFVSIFWMLMRKTIDNIEKLSKCVNEIGKGNFDSRPLLDGEDELTDLANNINVMANSLSDLIELQKTNERLKNELITNVSHDLKTPLTSILGYLDIVLSRKEYTPEMYKYITIAYDKALRLRLLIDELFEYTRINDLDFKLNFNKIDVVELIEQLVEEFYPVFHDNNINYKVTYSINPIYTLGDGNLLSRVFENLINNAVKYGKSGEVVDISITCDKDRLFIVVFNSGSYIQAKDLDKIFDKFYRVDNSRNHETGGTGLGLAIAKSIIDLHKGIICADSNQSGTSFIITLIRHGVISSTI